MKLDENCRLFVCGDNSYGELGLAEKYVNTFTCILPAHKVKLYSTINHHTIIVTTDNKVFYCGKGKKKLPQSNTPQ
jgi:alpha-tubulin suppressor-like RCC1 family protein